MAFICDQLQELRLWKLGIYLEDRDGTRLAFARPLDKPRVAARRARIS
jgi:hypothetical protein